MQAFELDLEAELEAEPELTQEELGKLQFDLKLLYRRV